MSQDTVNYIDATDLFYSEKYISSNPDGALPDIKEIRKIFDEVVKDDIAFSGKDYRFSIMVTDDIVIKIIVTTFMPVVYLEEPLIETASRFYPSYKEKDVEHFMTEAEGRVEFYYMAAERDGQSV